MGEPGFRCHVDTKLLIESRANLKKQDVEEQSET